MPFIFIILNNMLSAATHKNFLNCHLPSKSDDPLPLLALFRIEAQVPFHSVKYS